MEEVQGNGVVEGGDERLHPHALVAVEADAEQLMSVAEDDGWDGRLWRQSWGGRQRCMCIILGSVLGMRVLEYYREGKS